MVALGKSFDQFIQNQPVLVSAQFGGPRIRDLFGLPFLQDLALANLRYPSYQAEVVPFIGYICILERLLPAKIELMKHKENYLRS
jgi:hypothetical protein